MHSGCKPFKCKFCDYRSARKDSVKRHAKLLHQCLVSDGRSLADVVEIVEEIQHNVNQLGVDLINSGDENRLANY